LQGESDIWQVEEVPDQDDLYFRVHRGFTANGEVSPGAFCNRPKGSNSMSTDWAKYSTPEETRRRPGKSPHDYAVVKLNVGAVRSIKGQAVSHSPDKSQSNRAHCDVSGEKDTVVRAKLMDIFEIVIPLG
jgi:hypothetical protein